MTLGSIIKEYRESQGLSMDAFAEKSGMSKAYVSLLEKNEHPKTGKPIAPSVQTIKQAADAMGMDFNDVFNQLDGEVSLSEKEESDTEHYYEDPEVRKLAQFMFENPEYRVLFDAARSVRPEDILFIKELIDRTKNK